MMCLVEYGSIPAPAVLRSLELAGQHLVPAFARDAPEPVA